MPLSTPMQQTPIQNEKKTICLKRVIVQLFQVRFLPDLQEKEFSTSFASNCSFGQIQVSNNRGFFYNSIDSCHYLAA